MKNPYKDLNIETAHKVQSMSHEHAGQIGTTEEAIDELYGYGFRHFAFSEYGRFLPIDENKIFPEDYYGSAPVYPLNRWHSNPPSDIIASPNSEVFDYPGLGHIITLGSFAGHFGHNNQHFGIEEYEGNALWDVSQEKQIVLSEETGFDYIKNGINDPNGPGTIGGFQYPDGGGLYEAHSNNHTRVISLMDTYMYFLGMAMYNDRRDPNDPKSPNTGRGYHIAAWDEVLKTGRFCYGFGESDRGRRGCNILLLDDISEQNALKAYREGRFYTKTAWGDTGLCFKKINATEDGIYVETEGAVSGLKLITERGVVAETSGNAIEYKLPVKFGIRDVTYIRAEAKGALFTDQEKPEKEWPLENYADGVRYDDEIYTQPIMYRTKEQVDNWAALLMKLRNKRVFITGIF